MIHDPVFCFESLVEMPIELFEDGWRDYIRNLFKKKYE